MTIKRPYESPTLTRLGETKRQPEVTHGFEYGSPNEPMIICQCGAKLQAGSWASVGWIFDEHLKQNR